MVINHIKVEVTCMHNSNYFVKLLMISTKDDDFLLLYGFCSATAQEPYEWCQDMVPKTNQSIWKAILTEKENKLLNHSSPLYKERPSSGENL